MSDKTFERSLTTLTAVVVLWIILGIVFKVMAWGGVVVLALLVEIVAGGYLLRRWGKTYMEKE